MDPLVGGDDDQVVDVETLEANVNRACLHVMIVYMTPSGPATASLVEALVASSIMALTRSQLDRWYTSFAAKFADADDVEARVADCAITQLRAGNAPLRTNAAYFSCCAANVIRDILRESKSKGQVEWPAGLDPALPGAHLNSLATEENSLPDDPPEFHLSEVHPGLDADVIRTYLDRLRNKDAFCISSTANSTNRKVAFVRRTMQRYASRVFRKIKDAPSIKKPAKTGKAKSKQRDQEATRKEHLEQFMQQYFTTEDHSVGVKTRIAKSLGAKVTHVSNQLSYMRWGMSDVWQVNWDGSCAGLEQPTARKPRKRERKDGATPASQKRKLWLFESDLLWLAELLTDKLAPNATSQGRRQANQLLAVLRAMAKRDRVVSIEPDGRLSPSQILEMSLRLDELFSMIELAVRHLCPRDRETVATSMWPELVRDFSRLVKQAVAAEGATTLRELVRNSPLTNDQLVYVIREAARGFPDGFNEFKSRSTDPSTHKSPPSGAPLHDSNSPSVTPKPPTNVSISRNDWFRNDDRPTEGRPDRPP